MQQFLKDIRPLLYGRPVMYFDVGAYKGAVFNEVAEADWGTFLEAHLIEPNPESFSSLKKAAAAAEESKRAKQAHCHNMAADAKKGSLRFRSEGTRTRVLENNEHFDASNTEEYFEIKASTLDEIAATWGVKHISILKMDVEGHEGEVLKGAQNLLESHAVDILYVEAGIDPNNGQQYYYRSLEDTLAPLRYRLFRIYEQKNEWLTDSPFLRRVNLAFMSETFATQTPYRLSKKLFDLQRKFTQVESDLAAATESAAKAEIEHSAACKKQETQLSALQEKVRQAEETGKQQAAEFASRLAKHERALADKTVENARYRTSEEAGKRQAAELADKLAKQEKALADKEAKEATRKQQMAELETKLTGRLSAAAKERSALEDAYKTERSVLQKKITEGEARANKLASELLAYKAKAEQQQQEIAALQSKMQSESLLLQAKAAASEGSAQATKETVSFQLGSAILDALKSPSKTVTLPAALWKIHKGAGTRLLAKDLRAEISSRGPKYQAMLKILQESGLPALQEHFSALKLAIGGQAAVLGSLAKDIYPTAPQRAIEAGREAHKLDPKPFRAKWLAFRLYEQGGIGEAAGILTHSAENVEFSESEQKRKKEILAKFADSFASPNQKKGKKKDLKDKSNNGEKPKSGGGKPKAGGSAELSEYNKKRLDSLFEKAKSGFFAAAVRDLEAEVMNPRPKPGVREAASLRLATLLLDSKSSGGIEKALTYLDQFDIAGAAKQRSSLLVLKLNALSRLGRFAEAESLFREFASSRDAHPDVLLLGSNLLAGREKPVEGGWNRQALIERAFQASAGVNFPLARTGKLLSFRDLASVPQNRPAAGGEPLVSVVMPVFNCGAYIETSVASILGQSWGALELIIVDDASTDNTPAVLSELKSRDPRIKVIRLENNSGSYVSRNHALSVALGEFVTCQDADDWSHPERIRRQVSHLISHPEIIANVSHWARATEQIEFSSRPFSSKVIHFNSSSITFRRKPVVDRIGYWDSVRFGADTEFWHRMKGAFGETAVLELPELLAIARIRNDSLTRSKGSEYDGGKVGARKAYFQAHSIWHERNKEKLHVPFPLLERPFGVPGKMTPQQTQRTDYDVVIISDFRHKGGNTLSNIQEITAQSQAGLSTGLVQIDRYDFAVSRPIHNDVQALIDSGAADMLVYGDRVKARLAIVRFPAIFSELQDFLPVVEADNLRVVVNQPPQRVKGEAAFYSIEVCKGNIKKYLGDEGQWVPIGPAVRHALAEDNESHHLCSDDWFNIIDVDAWRSPRTAWRDRIPVIGRHGRDNFEKWPTRAEDILAAYPDDGSVRVRVLGGGTTPEAIIGRMPSNWEVLEFNQIPPEEFLASLDFFVFFPHEERIEAFGRTIIEAMASGCLVILPDDFSELFGEAAIYCAPQGAQEVVRKFYSDRALYERHIERAGEIVKKRFGFGQHIERVHRIVDRSVVA